MPADLSHPSYPRSSAYDADWLLGLNMGPNPLWLLEDLASDLTLEPGMRVLDLGSGRGATSVFLAKEYDVEVTAADPLISEQDAHAVFQEAGVADRVRAVNADVRALPFEAAAFDAIVSIDAWEYFGTDDRLLPGLLRYLRPGGQIGMATPCLAREFATYEDCPAHVREGVSWEVVAWHSPQWWKVQWERTGLLTEVLARAQPDGCALWLRWALAGVGRERLGPDEPIAMLAADNGENLSFALVSGRTKTQAEPAQGPPRQ